MEAARKECFCSIRSNDTVDEDGKVNGIMYQEGLPLVDEGDYTFYLLR